MDFTRAEAISIHAPLAGRDRLLVLEESLSNISIHAPLAGRDLFRHRQHCELQDFNPRAPRGARRLRDFLVRVARLISIHAPLAGRDFVVMQSDDLRNWISIHAPLAGRDCGR